MLLYSLLHLTGRQGGQRASTRRLGELVGHARRHQALPPARQQVPRPSRSTAGPRASRPPPARSARAWRPASAWPSRPSGWPRTSTARASTLFDYDVYALCGDGCMMEGIAARGRVAGRPPAARQPLLDLRQQPHHHRGPHGARLQRGRGHALHRPTAGTCTRVGDANDLEMLDARVRRPSSATTDRPTLIIVDSHIGYGSPTQAGHAAPPTASRSARRRSALTKRNYGWPEDAKFLVPDGVREHFARRHRRARRGSCATAWMATLRGVPARSIPSWPIELDRMQHRAAARRLGPGPARASRPTPRAWPAATPRARC